jgi:hypothetical protein
MRHDEDDRPRSAQAHATGACGRWILAVLISVSSGSAWAQPGAVPVPPDVPPEPPPNAPPASPPDAPPEPPPDAAPPPVPAPPAAPAPAPSRPPSPRRDDAAPPRRASLPPPGRSPPPDPRITGLLLRAGLEYGGDDLLKSTNGDSVTLSAGRLASVGAGFIVQPPYGFAIEATIGIKVDVARAPNGIFTFTRYPLELIASVTPGNNRFGLGVTVHLSPSLSCDLPGTCSSMAFDSAVGLMVQWVHHFGRGFSGFELGARYTFISYTVPNAPAGTPDIDGSAIGLLIGARY